MLRNIYEVSLVLVVFLFYSCGAISDSYKSHIDEEYIPRNLNDAVSELDKYINDSIKIAIRQMSEEDFLNESHFGRGQAIRNDWGLWHKSRLKRYFKRKGIFHADDMSSIILKSYYRKINNQEIGLKEQVKYYKDYWEDIKKGTDLIMLPKAKKHPEPNIEFGHSIHYGHHIKDKKWAAVHIQTNSTSDFHWIYDYHYGWKKIDNKTKKKLEDITIDEIQKIEEMLNEIFGE